MYNTSKMTKGTKIIDCFTFYNEIDMLKLRLKLLYPVVDYFVICEATRTFRGNIKPLYYASNKHLFAEYADKIVHLVDDELTVSAQTDNQKVWENEAHQRGYMWKGVESLLDRGLVSDDDYVVVSDLDEIPNPESLAGLGPNGPLRGNFFTLAMDMYYYGLEYKCTELWSLPKVIRCRELRDTFMKDMNWVRRTFSSNIIADAGWHLSYFGDVSFIQNKLANFGHQEYNTPEYTSADAIQNKIKNGEDLFGRDSVTFTYTNVQNNTRIPQTIKNHYYSTNQNILVIIVNDKYNTLFDTNLGTWATRLFPGNNIDYAVVLSEYDEAKYDQIENALGGIKIKYRVANAERQMHKLWRFVSGLGENYDWYVKIRPEIQLLDTLRLYSCVAGHLNGRARVYRGPKHVEYGMSVKGEGCWHFIQYDYSECPTEQEVVMDDQMFIFDGTVVESGVFNDMDIHHTDFPEREMTRLLNKHGVKLNVVGLNVKFNDPVKHRTALSGSF